MKKMKWFVPALATTAMLATSMPLLTSCGNEKAPEPQSFLEDSWSTISYYASKGLKALKKAYPEYADTGFIGLERELEIDDTPYTVKVVGENHDRISGDKTAALTFQFEGVITKDSPPVTAPMRWFNTDKADPVADWAKTDLFKKLNDESENGFTGKLEKSMGVELKKVIRPYLRKNEHAEGDKNPFEKKYCQSTLFLPSLSSYFHSNTIIATAVTHNLWNNEAIGLYTSLDTQYEYYEGVSRDLDLITDAWPTNYFATGSNYWFCDPVITDPATPSDGYKFALSFNIGTHLEQTKNVLDDATGSSIGISPLFCL